MISLSSRSIRRPLIFALAALVAAGVAPAAQAAGVLPTPPTNVVATAGNHEATITWDAPSSMGAGTFVRYEVEAAGVVRCTSTNQSIRTCTATGLTNAQGYAFAVRAVTLLGNGEWSQFSNTVVPGTPPTAPTNVAATAGDTESTVTWDAPSSMGTGAFVRYEVSTAGGAYTCTSTVESTRQCTVTGLTNGQYYAFYVRAVADGPGPWSDHSNFVLPTASTTATTPTAPAAPTATAGDTTADITWTDPSDFGDGTWVKWEVATNDGTIVCTVTSQTTHTCTATALTNDTPYQFKVRAVTSAGNGAYSALSTAVTPTASATDDGPVDVWRYWSPTFDNAHFFTMFDDEANAVDNDPNWEYEGVAFQAYAADQDDNCATGTPVWRYFSSVFESHFYTAFDDEATTVDDDPNWDYEGVAYCAFPTQEAGTTPLYRFWSPTYGKHFFTANANEAETLKRDPAWSYEGIVYYVVPAA